MPHMTIMRGGPGSGKSTIAKRIQSKTLHREVVVCSADHFFTDDDGNYDFDPRWLGRAHGACLKKCVVAMTSRSDVIIDNTNGSPIEMAPYLALCQAFDYSCTIVRVICDRETAWARQTHDVPRETFDKIFSAVETSSAPEPYRGAQWLTEREVHAA